MATVRKLWSKIDIPSTGNIYCDSSWDTGHRYRDYFIDCGDCGIEVMLDVHRHARTKTVAKKMGWVISKVHGKWICDKCAEKE